MNHYSLNWWIKNMNQIRSRIWNNQKKIVKKFRINQDYFEIILDEYILAIMINSYNFNDILNLLTNFIIINNNLIMNINIIIKYFAYFDIISKMKWILMKKHDISHESIIIFMQYEFILRNFKRIIWDKNNKWILFFLIYFMIWFQDIK